MIISVDGCFCLTICEANTVRFDMCNEVLYNYKQLIIIREKSIGVGENREDGLPRFSVRALTSHPYSQKTMMMCRDHQVFGLVGLKC